MCGTTGHFIGAFSLARCNICQSKAIPPIGTGDLEPIPGWLDCGHVGWLSRRSGPESALQHCAFRESVDRSHCPDHCWLGNGTVGLPFCRLVSLSEPSSCHGGWSTLWPRD